ncbi:MULTISPECIES: hypothetical protein [Rhodococcus]|uniref:Uncharacterized protein n=1 Tax=Rhodococcus opacus (strain B4) TaxID=632772 RepID=C1BD10_RHOOB|nr:MULTISPECIES: hypothetical protein [Rhodococcus]KAF0957537.1 hypothetical protein MLGJGCBP_09369 [Rhodococcus sp. T7]KAF0963718.1 hypothetical protein MLGJGCBP_03142 [Rhodococcus sp. T7]QQZ19238.1 hypothetical protein GO592_38060 [Rhodococcus sp. 21391]UOT08009.1 hypothetical protein MPY17_37130 [Rhodococcus opacus]BAH55754.1 hypothetical protein ROP_pROB01-02550 [Rhodococcus opacus B4]
MQRSSVHSKGDALDPVIAEVTRGQPYRHVMGFEAGERRRAEKDAGYNTDLRTGEYPLIEWGWFRDDAIAYTKSVIGTRVGKSACTCCPFAFANKSTRAEIFARYAADPAKGRSRGPLFVTHRRPGSQSRRRPRHVTAGTPGRLMRGGEGACAGRLAWGS